jgi:acyl-CoA hydrolase
MEILNSTGHPQSGSFLTRILVFRRWRNATSNHTCFEALPAALRRVKPPVTDSDLATMPRPVRDSQSEMAEIVLPNDANPLGALLGGRLMHWIDLAGALAAHRHSRHYVVTAAIDHLDFLFPVRVGDLVILRSSVNRVFRTSMEVGVKVWVENYLEDSSHHISSAYLTFVAVDKQGKTLVAPPVIPENEEQQRRYQDAGRRREIRRTEFERRTRQGMR